MKVKWLGLPAMIAVLALSTQVNAGMAKEDALALAKKSGCLACHSIEKKVVGPSWNDVAAKYKSDGAAKAMLITKVKKGGKGNWAKITGGAPMPPYSPRVKDADIEALVDFILTL
ncbi:MAG: c-type cytochrome [Gammaproteobacteria bacterium]|nr:c-type cytochrome [Gammaproteobacteria bacterium]